MKGEYDVLLDNWPKPARVFVGLVGGVAGFLTAVAVAVGTADVPATAFMLGFSVLLASLFLLESRTVLDDARPEVVKHFRWGSYRTERRIPLTRVAAVFVQPLGKGGGLVGLQLTDGSDVALCRQNALAWAIANRLGVPVTQRPYDDVPTTTGGLVASSVFILGLVAGLGYVAWLLGTTSATDGKVHPLAGGFIGLFALAALVGGVFQVAKGLRKRSEAGQAAAPSN